MKACVSTMLTRKRFEYFTARPPLQGSGASKRRMQDDKRGADGAFRLDSDYPDAAAAPTRSMRESIIQVALSTRSSRPAYPEPVIRAGQRETLPTRLPCWSPD